jgi:hypothetical protein
MSTSTRDLISCCISIEKEEQEERKQVFIYHRGHYESVEKLIIISSFNQY